jgi:hypothetical protein
MFDHMIINDQLFSNLCFRLTERNFTCVIQLYT